MKITNKNPEEWRRIIELTEQMSHGEVTIKVADGRIQVGEFTVRKKAGNDATENEGALLTLEL